MRAGIGRLRWPGLRVRYVLSFALIMALPLIALAALFHNSQINDLQNSVEELHKYRIDQVRLSFDSRFSDLYSIGEAVAGEYKLRPDYILTRRSNEMEAVALLDAYNRRNTLTSDAFLYLIKNDRFYATDGVMTAQAMTGYEYKLREDEAALLMEWVRRADGPLMHTVSVEGALKRQDFARNTLMVKYPLRLSGGKPYGMLLFVITPDELLRLLSEALGGMDASLAVYDADGRTIVSDMDLHFADFAPDANVPLTGTGIERARIDQADVSVVYSHSQKSGLLYAAALPTKDLMGRVLNQQMLIFQISLTVLLLGLGMAAMMAWIHYRPIRGLLEEAGITAPDAGHNELDLIKRSMRSYIDSNQRLHTLVDRHASYVVEHIVEMLLGGSIDVRDAREILQKAHKDFPHPYYQVVAIGLGEVDQGDYGFAMRKAVTHLLVDLEAELCGDAKLYSVERGNERAVLILINRADLEDELAIALTIIERVSAAVGEPVPMGAGLVCETPEHIQRSFVEAMAALEYVRYQRGGLLSFSEIGSSAQEGAAYPKEDFQRLMQSLKQGNVEVATESLKQLCDAIQAGKTSSIMARLILFDIINAVVKFASDTAPNQFKEELRNLMIVHSPGKFYGDMLRLIPKLCARVDEMQADRMTALRTRMLDYVKAHFDDPSLSLEQIAYHFQLSTYYVSRFFTEQTGRSFKEHVITLRVNKAKALLLETDMPVQDIVVQVGYYNVSSFIKKFKGLTGATPGDFRRQSTKKNGEDDEDDEAIL